MPRRRQSLAIEHSIGKVDEPSDIGAGVVLGQPGAGVNAEPETELARQMAEEVVGAENVQEIDRITGEQDSVTFLMRAGVSPARSKRRRESVPPVHTARCDFSDENLTFGAAFWTRLVERFL
jgi:hippurate hydrolase